MDNEPEFFFIEKPAEGRLSFLIHACNYVFHYLYYSLVLTLLSIPFSQFCALISHILSLSLILYSCCIQFCDSTTCTYGLPLTGKLSSERLYSQYNTHILLLPLPTLLGSHLPLFSHTPTSLLPKPQFIQLKIVD